ncbi:hypothetical protein [Levilactobacillus suantsaii]|uniref:Uncharacterized protein n=1 Tax=Levilactobacillus suantsaii TaxID=2292255 RepID=A0A4Q0VJR7_9LACO|nr:hypothetical protein [Levilactobacillus suantsaii]QMU07551.1 hypothetical protein H3M12_08730 [Levilactobacillus suantsaii]RXI79624.1 hypothetical protein DXH47_02560 [Levilactobacillus suantsaii]
MEEEQEVNWYAEMRAIEAAEDRALCVLGSPLTNQEIAVAAEIPLAVITAVREQEVDYRMLTVEDILSLDDIYELAQEAFDEPEFFG